MALTEEERKQRQRESSLRWRNRNKERAREIERAWRAVNHDKIREGDRRRYAEDPEKNAAEKRARYHKNPEKHMASTRQSGIRHLEKRMLQNAKYRKGSDCTITLEDIVIPDVCPVYGIPLDRAAPPRSPNKPSLDRIDNTKGYIPGNVCVISWAANSDKSNLTLDQAKALVRYMSGESTSGVA